MTVLSPALGGTASRIAMPPSAVALRAAFQAGGSAAAAPARAPNASTHVTLGAAVGVGIGYAMPLARDVAPRQIWDGAHDDALGMQMLSNIGRRNPELKDLWRGLGGGLLRQLAETGEGTAHTLAVVKPPPDDPAALVGDAAPNAVSDEEAAQLDAEALSDVATDAVTVKLTLTTRSGQSVELEIAVNDGLHDGTRGLQVKVSPSGKLTEAERDALAEMADGLDQALEGLGQAAPKLDLSPLRAFNRSGELTELKLSVEDPNLPTQPGALRAFSLKMDADQTALKLKRTGSEMALSVAAKAPGAVAHDRRQSAIASLLAQIDAAADRGHADRPTVNLFQEAFRQLQTPPADTAPPPADDGPAAPVQALQSGLADYEASFSGVSHKRNHLGGVVEQGSLDYRIGQTTSSTVRGGTGDTSITQVKTEAADASIQRTRTLFLDIPAGNHDNTTIRDRSTQTTLIDTAGSAVKRALRKTDEHLLAEFASLAHDRVTARRETPLDRSFVERLR